MQSAYSVSMCRVTSYSVYCTKRKCICYCWRCCWWFFLFFCFHSFTIFIWTVFLHLLITYWKHVPFACPLHCRTAPNSIRPLLNLLTLLAFSPFLICNLNMFFPYYLQRDNKDQNRALFIQCCNCIIILLLSMMQKAHNNPTNRWRTL